MTDGCFEDIALHCTVLQFLGSSALSRKVGGSGPPKPHRSIASDNATLNSASYPLRDEKSVV